MMMAEDPKSEAELTEIPASEILDKIQAGKPVEYDHVRIIKEILTSTSSNRRKEARNLLPYPILE